MWFTDSGRKPHWSDRKFRDERQDDEENGRRERAA
jgi:hypothetical protein